MFLLSANIRIFTITCRLHQCLGLEAPPLKHRVLVISTPKYGYLLIVKTFGGNGFDFCIFSYTTLLKHLNFPQVFSSNRDFKCYTLNSFVPSSFLPSNYLLAPTSSKTTHMINVYHQVNTW